MKKNVILALACLSSTLFLGSCCGKCSKNASEATDSTAVQTVAVNAPAAEEVLNAQYTLATLNGTAIEKEADAEEAPNIQFNWEEKRVAAYVGCNRIFANFEAGEDGSLTFVTGASTKMMCPPTCREDEFLDAFNKVAKYAANDTQISFMDAEGNTLFVANK